MKLRSLLSDAIVNDIVNVADDITVQDIIDAGTSKTDNAIENDLRKFITSKTVLNAEIITNSNANESDITIAEQQTVFTTATKFEVFQVLGDGALANCEEKGHSTSFFTGPVVYIVTDGQNLFYDDQVIEVPKGKKAMQIGTFRYETKLGEKVVPVIKFQ